MCIAVKDRHNRLSVSLTKLSKLFKLVILIILFLSNAQETLTVSF